MGWIAPDVPVILTSGYSEQEVVARFEGTPLAGFVQKPYKIADLLGKVETALAESDRRKEAAPTSRQTS